MAKRIEDAYALDALLSGMDPPKPVPPSAPVVVTENVVPRLTPAEEERFNELDEKETPESLKWRWAEDVMWCYRHIDNMETTALSAPSRGAWTMLWALARADKQEFLKKDVRDAARDLKQRDSAALALEANLSAGVVLADVDEVKQLRMLEQMLVEAVKESKEYKVWGGKVKGPYTEGLRTGKGG